MKKDLLQRVIDTERDISKSVASEKEKAAAWLAFVKQSCVDRVEGEREESEQLFSQAVEDYVLRKRELVAASIKGIENAAAALDRTSDHFIRAVVLKHLRKILPGDGHDRQDVQD